MPGSDGEQPTVQPCPRCGIYACPYHWISVQLAQPLNERTGRRIFDPHEIGQTTEQDGGW